MNPELTGAAPKAAPKKKSNVGLIIGIIAGALVIAGGTVAAILIINNANNGGSSEGGDQEIAQDISEPYKDDKAYFVKINGKTFTNKSQIKDLTKAGYEASKYSKGTNVKVNGYVFGGSVSNSDNGTSLSVNPYNDGEEKVTFEEGKLGHIEIRSSIIEKTQAIYEKIEIYGGIHLGSTRKEVEKAFGKPTDEHEYENYDGSKYQKLEYKDKVYKKFEFKIDDGVVTEMSWTNYGGLNK